MLYSVRHGLTELPLPAGAKEDTFDVWMKQESDTVQALGMAYAERETIEACYRVIQEVHISSICLYAMVTPISMVLFTPMFMFIFL